MIDGATAEMDHPPRGFEGIDFFEEIDRQSKRMIIIESGPRDSLGGKSIIFDPGSGHMYYFLTVEKNGRLKREALDFNVRKGQYNEGETVDKNPRKDTLMLDGLRQISSHPEGQKYIPWFSEPPGYPEVMQIIESVTSKEHAGLENVTKGDYILLQQGGEIVASRFAGSDPFDPSFCLPEGSERIYTTEDPIKLTINYDRQTPIEIKIPDDLNYDHTENYIGSYFSKERESLRGNKPPSKIWIIDEKTYKQLKDYATPYLDPSVEKPLTREEYTIAMAFDGMAHERWGADQEVIRKKYPDRYKEITKENYTKAIAILVDRFGREALLKACKWMFTKQLFHLHTPLHKGGDDTIFPQAINNMFGDVHSDTIGFQWHISRLAMQAVDSIHPVAEDMEEHGKWGIGVYNTKTLVGDIDFWEIMQEKYSEEFVKLVEYYKSIPSVNQGQWYGYTTVYPIQALREFFPDAYNFIKTHYDGEFDASDGVGIDYTSSPTEA